MTTADEIRELIRAGWSSPAIVEHLGCSRQAVWNARQVMTPAPVGKPRKHPACTHCHGTGYEPERAPYLDEQPEADAQGYFQCLYCKCIYASQASRSSHLRYCKARPAEPTPSAAAQS